jgi:hypothetical protein
MTWLNSLRRSPTSASQSSDPAPSYITTDPYPPHETSPSYTIDIEKNYTPTSEFSEWSKPKECLCFELTERQLAGWGLLIVLLFYITTCGVAYAIHLKISDLPIIWFFGIPVSPKLAGHTSTDHKLTLCPSQLAIAMLIAGLGLACAGLTHAKCPPLVQAIICATVLAAYMACCGVVYNDLKQTNEYKTDWGFANAVYEQCLLFYPVSIPSTCMCGGSIVADCSYRLVLLSLEPS